jgi:ABC-type uncharacterized transport system YnjBCD substrate-binding protein
MAQFVFYHDTATLPEPPRSIPAILAWSKAHPGRFTYPQPPNFLGSTFLKQALFELAGDTGRLAKPSSRPSSRPPRRPCGRTSTSCTRRSGARARPSPRRA